jgi:hypothetical protein
MVGTVLCSLVPKMELQSWVYPELQSYRAAPFLNHLPLPTPPQHHAIHPRERELCMTDYVARVLYTPYESPITLCLSQVFVSEAAMANA